ncbi:unnamed protein product [Durusdinium trenchii]|uniref:NAD-dependent epimerase/dehydratase domain-containing protein n=1 Tax=Durusdinium trenchii TaxID=1381693 RepID=A0ABP0PHI4_9DINO
MVRKTGGLLLLLLWPSGLLINFSLPDTTEQRHAVVTGAAGYLGRELCAQLLEDHWRVTALVREVSAERAQALAELAKDIGGDFQILSLDLLDDVALQQTMTSLRPSVIFHAGGRVSAL